MLYFFRRVSPFQRHEYPVLSYEMTGNFQEFWQCSQRPCNHGIKAVAGCIVLSPGFDDDYVTQTQQSRSMLDEHDFLVIAIQQGESPLGLNNCERQPRKSRPGTDIENLVAMQKWPGNKAIQQVCRDHFVRITNCGQVERPVPLFEFIKQGSQFPSRAFRVRLSQLFKCGFDSCRQSSIRCCCRKRIVG